MKSIKRILIVLLMALVFTGCTESNETPSSTTTVLSDIDVSDIKESISDETTADIPSNNIVQEFDVTTIPEYSGEPYVVVNDNNPYFDESDLVTTSYEYYSDLDFLGRCQTVMACIGIDIMPTEERGEIGSVKPTGWHTIKYDCVDGKYLYNRCHLIGYQLTGENANTKNLITGTRYLNVNGMLPFENMIADYVKETGNHVLYRVTPIFEANNLVASGVLLEAESVEDAGAGILFNVYCYNVQPGVNIDYSDGESSAIVIEETITQQTTEQEIVTQQETTTGLQETTYILNTNTKKFHYSYCSSVNQMNEENKQVFTGSRDEIISMGYDSCGRCNP